MAQDPVGLEWLREHAPAGVWVYELTCARCGVKVAGVTRAGEDPSDPRDSYYCDRCIEWVR